jgi:hypothetical protein
VEVVPILLNLQRVLDGVIFDNLTKFIVWNLVEFGGMIETDVANKLVHFRTNGMAIF